MFYSEAILSRRGPLGKVWLAAHMERKLSKTQTLQTDIEQSVDAIMGQEVEVMALRLSGQLLLGVVRIYSRKAKYLLDDCNEALLKIKMAFRPGVVDMTEDQLAVNKQAITLQTGGMDLDMFMPDLNWDMDLEDRPAQQLGHQHQANIDDITLRAAEDFAAYDLNDNFDLGPSDGIGSNDFENLDLGLDFGDGPRGSSVRAGSEGGMDVDDSVEIGRDAQAGRDSISGRFGVNGDMDLDIFSNKSRDPSEHPFDLDVDMGEVPDFGGMDLGELGIGFGDQPELNGDGDKTPGQTRDHSRASSPLSDAPHTPPPGEDPEAQIVGDTTPKPKPRKRKEKKNIIDNKIEMDDGPGPRLDRRNGGLGRDKPRDVSDIVTEPQFLPRSATVMRYLEIREDPLAHFLPTVQRDGQNYLCAAPPGMVPELAELFMVPLAVTPKKRARSPGGKDSNKRPRLDSSVDGDFDEVEQGLRAESVAPSMANRSDLGGMDATIDFGDQTGGFEDYQLDVPEFEQANVPPSRLSTPAAGFEEEPETYADASCPIATFDVKPSQSQSQEKDPDVVDTEGKGYSKNTVKALNIVRRELQPDTEQDGTEKVLSFNKMADKASRRAAASFFFELLVLSTRDCVKVSQDKPFENIEVRAKEKLWAQQHVAVAPEKFEDLGSPRGSSRGASVARSIGSAMGL